MRHLFYLTCILLTSVLLANLTASAQTVTLPEPVRVDVNGKQLLESPPPASKQWGQLVDSNLTPLFPGCIEGQYYVGFQLYYDLGDKNTTSNWNAHLKVSIMRDSEVTPIWEQPLEIDLTSQNFISTNFYNLPISCATNLYQYKVTEITETGAVSVPSTNVWLKPIIYKVHEDFNSSILPALTVARQGNLLSLSWSYSGKGAVEYDVEWVTLADYENAGITTSQDAFAFKASAGITTAASYYKQMLLSVDGKIGYRVRAVGYKNANPAHRILGQWAYSAFGGSQLSIFNSQTTMTWQAQTAFAEEGKFKKVVNYYDGTSRNRQTVTSLGNAENINAMISETLYDFEGRPAVTLLPAPSFQTGAPYNYRAGYTGFSSQWAPVTNNTSVKHRKFHYDNGRMPNSKVGSGNGPAFLYSIAFALHPYNNTPLQNYLPKADGYVYSQTEFSRDANSKVVRESGVGYDFRMEGNHTARTFYAQPASTELVRLFGSNVGDSKHYKKKMTIDPNLQASVTYFDQEGRTIATALAGEKPANVDVLPSYPASPADFTVDLTDKNVKDLTRSVTTHKILNDLPQGQFNTQYTITYTLSALVGQVPNFQCVDCSYDLDISVIDPDGIMMDLSSFAGNEFDPGSSAPRPYKQNINVNCITTQTRNIVITLLLTKPGDHTIVKKLTPRVPSYDAVKTKVLLSTSETQIKSDLSTVYPVDLSDCTTCLTACPDANKYVNEAIDEIVSLDCENILRELIQEYKDSHSGNEPSPANDYLDLQNYNPGEWCKYNLCRTNVASDVFDKQIARIPNWTSAKAGGFVDNTTIGKLVSNDPFFKTVNGVQLSGFGHDSDMITNYLTSINVGGVSGTIISITDPNNSSMADENGYHRLYGDLMSKRSSMTATEFAKQLDERRWLMFRNFYNEAKRQLKLHLTAYMNCQGAMDNLHEVEDLPDTQQEITDAATAANLTFGVNPDGVTLTNCFVPLNGFSTTNKVANPAFRFWFDDYGPCSSDLLLENGCLPNWKAAAGRPTLNGVGNGFGDGYGREILLHSAPNCATAESDAVRGNFTSTLIPGKIYKFTFKYKAVNDGGMYAGQFDEARIQFSQTSSFIPNGTPGSNAGARDPEGYIPPPPPPVYEIPPPPKPGFGPFNMPAPLPDDVQVQDCPGYPTATDPDAIRILGSANSTTLVWQKQNHTVWDTYTEITVTFVALQPSKYFYVMLDPHRGPDAAVFKDFKLVEALDGFVVCNPVTIDPTYSIDINWSDYATKCITKLNEERDALVNLAFERVIDDKVTQFLSTYNCITAATETLNYKYKPREYHYTLYYYDQAGNLVQTVPPNGVNPSSGGNHSFLTKYQYNSYNQTISQQTPDAGPQEFSYDKKGRLRLARNAQQRADLMYSYTKFDNIGRIREVGSLKSTTQDLPDIDSKVEKSDFPKSTDYALSDITWTYYDTPDASITSTFPQQYLRNRVSYTEVTDQDKAAGDPNNIKTYYSYDIHGNVKALRQDIPGLSPKKVNYAYDLISNKVRYAFFQFGETDQFAHRYEYDDDDKLKTVYTSTDRYIWNKEADYSYYAHGPLARMELGKYRVQGLDYLYTLQGWLKGVNMPYAGDPGADGEGTSTVGKDVTSFNLGYFKGDYRPVDTLRVWADKRDDISSYYNTSAIGYGGQFNGNISWMITDLAKQGELQSDRSKGVQAKLYLYDQLNRLVRSLAMTSYTYNTSTQKGVFGTPSGNGTYAYDELFSYDPNGNLQTLKRRDATNALKDDFTYQYYSGTNKLLDTQLVTDLVISSGAVTTNTTSYRNITLNGTSSVASGANTTIKAMQSVQLSPSFNAANGSNFWAKIDESSAKYQYDAIGNLTVDRDNATIKWNPQGKVREVTATNQLTSVVTVTSFRYDAMGNRIEKKVVNPSGTTITRYLRDATGNVMSVYNDTTPIEYPIYGSSRLGQYVGGASEGKVILGQRRYELSNHLGNVLGTIDDKVSMSSTAITANTLSTADYYAFGGEMPGRVWKSPSFNYRYGFNGKEKDADAEWGSTEYDYGFRIYNPTLARFLSVDPLTKEYPWYTPYQFAGNKPIVFIDRDGLEEARPEEYLYGGLHPIDAITVSNNSKKAITTAGQTFLPGPRDGLHDAFRHTYWNALNARDIGADDAAPFATIHELGSTNPANDPTNPEYDPVAIRMDLHNNEVGRKIGSLYPTATDEELAALVLQSMANGELQIITNPSVTDFTLKTIGSSKHPSLSSGAPVATGFREYDEDYDGQSAIFSPSHQQVRNERLKTIPKSGTTADHTDSYGNTVDRTKTGYWDKPKTTTTKPKTKP